MTGSVPCWTKPLHRRTFPGEHADSAEELELDALRHQLREARAQLEATEKLKNELATNTNGGPSRDLVVITLGQALSDLAALRRENAELREQLRARGGP